jgi:hypothetical protein
MRDWITATGKGALAAAASAAVAYIVVAYAHVPLDEPWKQLVALAAVAIYNRFVRQTKSAS